jgi:uncharacterized protein
VDGTAEGHDRYRRFLKRTVQLRGGLCRPAELIPPSYRHLFGGLLCTIELRNDPV